MILPILRYPHPLLAQKAKPVEIFDDTLRKLANDMAETMYSAEGLGIAAPQVAVMQRVIVVDVQQMVNRPKLYTLVNPTIISKEGIYINEREGCLSLPGVTAAISRPAMIKVTAQDVEGNHFELEAEGLFAACICHEIDHLDAILFIDHLSRLKRKIAMKYY